MKNTFYYFIYILANKIYLIYNKIDMQGNGNINYSLNKKDFSKILISNTFTFIPFYFILVILSISYLFKIKYSLLYHLDLNNKYIKDNDLDHYFKSITFNSPFNIMSLNIIKTDDKCKDIDIKDNNGKNIINCNKYIGLASHSYVLFIISYIIIFIIILNSLIKNVIYSIYSNIIQVNPNNNPYNNMNCISKTSENPNISVTTNYFIIISFALIFLIPFFIPFLISLFKFDNYDIKHKKWFAFLLLFLMFAPLICIILFITLLNNKLSIFPNLYRFIEPKDNNFINFIVNNFNFKMGLMIPYLFIILIYFYYNFANSGKIKGIANQLKFYGLFMLVLFILIPVFIIFFIYSLIFTNVDVNIYANNDSGSIESAQSVVENIMKRGVSSLYDLLVKYNYPCFTK